MLEYIMVRKKATRDIEGTLQVDVQHMAIGLSFNSTGVLVGSWLFCIPYFFHVRYLFGACFDSVWRFE
jgi:hypothetical protein